jgi:hypothetical protein
VAQRKEERMNRNQRKTKWQATKKSKEKQRDKKHKKGRKSKQTKRENVEQQNNQGQPVKPSAVCVAPSGSAEWLSFNNCVVPPPDGECSLHPMLVAPKRADHLDSMTPFTRFHRLTISRLQENLPQTSS